jgi:hypothetical protein
MVSTFSVTFTFTLQPHHETEGVCRQTCAGINVWALMLTFRLITTQQASKVPPPPDRELYAREKSDSDVFTNRSSCVSSAPGGRIKAVTS